MKKWTTLVLLMFLAGVLGFGIWYYFQKDYHPALLEEEYTEELKITDESEQGPEQGPTTGAETVNEAEHTEESEVSEASIVAKVTDNQWGVMLTAKDVTPDGMTLVCTQSGGNPTGELLSGAWYQLEVLKDGQWMEAPCYAEVCWEDIAWNIPMEGNTQWETDWTWIYGSLEPGEYRIGKEIMDFRQTGDYDTCICYAYFAIE